MDNKKVKRESESKISILCGDNIEVLKTYPDNHFHSIVCDPPYGLGKEPSAEEMLRAWLEHGYLEVKGGGFMNKFWDSFVPQPLFWKEAFRVLKPGGHVLSFYGTRTFDWGVMAMRLAGFEIRDSIVYHHGSGFPKNHNISIAIDKHLGAEREVIGKKEGTYADIKRDKETGQDGLHGGIAKERERVESFITAPATDEAKKWAGFGTALKPASEPIVMARKPIEKGLSIAENVLKWGTGGINIDGCRIAGSPWKWGTQTDIRGGNYNTNRPSDGDVHAKNVESNRFPANVILTHSEGCQCVGLKKVKGSSCGPDDVGKGRDGNFTNGIYGAKESKVTVSHTDENGEEVIEDWNCVDGCPIKLMDEQSGGSDDSAGASRFFYCAKVSPAERNWGLGGGDFDEKEATEMTNRKDGSAGLLRVQNPYAGKSAKAHNHHPTVKPVSLLRYLVRMITPPGGICLDPFVGSGTTGIACKLEGFDFVGIEQDADYCKIAEARIKNWTDDLDVMTRQLEMREKKEAKRDVSQLDVFDVNNE